MAERGPLIFTSFDKFADAAGEHLGYSQWHDVTQNAIDMFAEATRDEQWIHVDAERAAQGPFGTTIAHGYFTLSLLPFFTRQIYRVEGLAMAINYGVNKVRFPAPLPVGSSIRAGAELISVTRSSRSAQAQLRVTIEQKGGSTPVCVAEGISLMVLPEQNNPA